MNYVKIGKTLKRLAVFLPILFVGLTIYGAMGEPPLEGPTAYAFFKGSVIILSSVFAFSIALFVIGIFLTKKGEKNV